MKMVVIKQKKKLENISEAYHVLLLLIQILRSIFEPVNWATLKKLPKIHDNNVICEH